MGAGDGGDAGGGFEEAAAGGFGGDGAGVPAGGGGGGYGGDEGVEVVAAAGAADVTGVDQAGGDGHRVGRLGLGERADDRGVDEGVAGLVQVHPPGARHLDRGHDPVPRVARLVSDCDALGPQVGDGRVEVVAHQRDLVVRCVGRMHRHLGGRQREGRPPGVGPHRSPAERVAEHRPQRIRFRRVEQRVHPGDRHGARLTAPGCHRRVSTAVMRS